MKKVLILGAGLVAKPIVEYLLGNRYFLTIASPMKDRAEKMINGNPFGLALDWSMDEPEILEKIVAEHDLTVSLLPYKYHPDVAKVCLRNFKSLVTTSYVSKEMQDMNISAKEAGVIFLNETGLDPGIDHMSAMRIIDYVHGKGGKVEEFYSFCGALPAPEAANNPMKYKFSWSPTGVILASLNNALYLKKGKKIFVDSANVFKDTFMYKVTDIGELEVYPNRDSISYIDIYGIPGTKTMYRGTFRYKGWCETLDAMKGLSMFEGRVKNYSGMSYSGFLADCIGMENANLKKKIMNHLKVSTGSAIIQSLDFLGFFSNEQLIYAETTPFEITSGRMIKKMTLSDEERDMVVLQHVMLASWPDGKKEVIKSSMIDFGSAATNTAIARTVALPAAIAVKLILEDKISLTGVHRPVHPEIYDPIIKEMKTLGIEMKEEYGLPEDEIIP